MRTLLVAALLGLAAPATADTRPSSDVTKMATDDCARARKAGKTCVLTIEDEDIEGGVPRIGETSVAVIEFPKTANLITLRRDFIPEILKSAEDL